MNDAGRRWRVVRLLCLLLLPLESRAAPDCAATLRELKALVGDADFPLEWHETSMDDGKPLVVSILEQGGMLHLEFVKTGEGLWARSEGLFCAKGAGFETRFTRGQVRLGPAAGWLARAAFSGGGHFSLARSGRDELRITTTGWSGTFSSRAAGAK